jgi:integrase
MSARRGIQGLTVYQRGKTWTYAVEGERDPLTGERVRPSKGGFPSEESAWQAGIDAKRRLDIGKAATSKRIRVRDFFDQWLLEVAPSLKPTTLANYQDNVRAYVNPVLGDRWLGELTVQTLNQFYRHLATSGRRKDDRNTAMYEYWRRRKDVRNGLGPRPSDIARACGTTIHAARAAAGRFRRGRTPKQFHTGLARKSVKNVHALMHRSLRDAVSWGYLHANPAEHALLPRVAATNRVQRESPWTVEELGRWLAVALGDRYDGIWALVATTGMRRSELAGLHRDLLDLDGEFLAMEDTRVVVAGQAQESDGKTRSGRRGVSLDAFTVQHLRRYVARIDSEKEAFGADYPNHRLLVVAEDGRPLHPDTITRRFNRLVDKAGVRRIRLHDVRHTYVTLCLDAGIDVKLISDRVGHANMNVTLQIYTHRSTGLDRVAAQRIGGLIASALPLPTESD